MNSTIAKRRKLWMELGKKIDAWVKMSNVDLLVETKKVFPAVSEATREEMLKFLVMDHTEKMVQ